MTFVSRLNLLSNTAANFALVSEPDIFFRGCKNQFETEVELSLLSLWCLLSHHTVIGSDGKSDITPARFSPRGLISQESPRQPSAFHTNVDHVLEDERG